MHSTYMLDIMYSSEVTCCFLLLTGVLGHSQCINPKSVTGTITVESGTQWFIF